MNKKTSKPKAAPKPDPKPEPRPILTGKHVFENGCTEHYDSEGRLHCTNGPAVEFRTETGYHREWWEHGVQKKVERT